MKKQNPNIYADEKSYFDLSEHNITQVIVFIILIGFGIFLIFHTFLPVIHTVVEEFLNGTVVNNGKIVAYDEDTPSITRMTNYFTSWAIDIYKGTRQEGRYWFNPVLSLAIPSTLISIVLAIVITSVLPRNIGLMRQKIEREIVYAIERISLRVNGYHSRDERTEIVQEVLNADLKDLHELRDKWGYTITDLKNLHKALLWREGSVIYKLWRINDGLNFYMRFYFTERFGNTMLGMVYIGAAVLILIIGLRGLKFIPSTQPSLIFFALGLEFSLLLVYAFTIMYSRNEEENQSSGSNTGGHDTMFLSNDFGNTKEVEKLLRVFIKSKKPGANAGE